MTKQSWGQRKDTYELPYMIMQLEKEIEERVEKVRSMRLRLKSLKKLELNTKKRGMGG